MIAAPNDFGKAYDDYSQSEKAIFVSVLNRPHKGLDKSIRNRDVGWKVNGDDAVAESESAIEFIDSAAGFLGVEDPPLEYIIPEITPKAAIKTAHGDPRTMKSLGALEEFIAAGTGTPAYGLARFKPVRPYRVLYCSQEDAAPIVRPRVKKMLKARGIDGFPDSLGFAVFKGIDFDNEEWRERFFAEVVRGGYEVAFIDPVRGFTAFADAGPKDVLPLAKFFRRLTVLGITIHLVHHDTKPPASGLDTRRRSHRASGGGWFSVSECPVAYERISDRQSLVSPEDFKFSSDPAPFTITYQEDESGIRLIGEDSTATEAHTLAIDEKVLAYLAEHVGANGTAIIKTVRARKEAVYESLERLLTMGKVDFAVSGRSKLWTLRSGASQ